MGLLVQPTYTIKIPDNAVIKNGVVTWTANRLAHWIENKDPKDMVFHHDVHSLMSSFKRDCQHAGIERFSEDGRSIDVHSLRRTFVTMLVRAGVPLTTTQRLMRHSTPELTARLYIDVEPIDMYDAIDKLG